MSQCFASVLFLFFLTPVTHRRSPISLVQLKVFSCSFNGVEDFPFHLFQSSTGNDTKPSVGPLYEAIVETKL